MLFLAVFCGFMAENQREHIIENKREKQYMHSLMEDLPSDTATMKQIYKLALFQKKLMDSLIELGNRRPLKGEDIRRLYLLHGKTGGFLNIHLEDGTSSQLKNAGGMRLIRSEEVSGLIRKYWDHVEVLYRIRDRLEMAGEKINDVSARIFDNKYMTLGDEPLDPPVEISPGPAFIDDEPKLLAEYINRVASKMRRTGVYINELRDAIEAANSLLESIRKEYHLE